MSAETSQARAIEIIRNADVVSLDWDGTLVNSVSFKIAQNQAIAREFGNDLTIDEVRRIWNDSKGFPELMQRLTKSDDMDAIMEVVMRDYDNPEYAKQPFPFAEGFLKTLRELGKRTVLITNATREILNADAQMVGLMPLGQYFDHIQTAEESTHKKPDPRVFDPSLEALGVEAHQVVYIGDELKDYYAARDAGIAFIGVETGMATAQEFIDAGAFSVSSLGDVSLSDLTR